MNTIGAQIRVDPLSPEAAQVVEDSFVTSARRAGAIKAGVVKENGQWGKSSKDSAGESCWNQSTD
jgi:hypothetical protein